RFRRPRRTASTSAPSATSSGTSCRRCQTDMAGRAPKFRRAAGSTGSFRFAIVAARFNERITQRLVAGALQALRAARLGPDAIEVHWVPGSFELPQAANHLAMTGRYSAIVCVGVVIRGQTPHFEHVAREAAAGIRDVALQFLYQLDLNGDDDPSPHDEEFWARHPVDDDTRAFADALVRGAKTNQAKIDHAISQFAEHWDLERMAVVDRNILRLAVY